MTFHTWSNSAVAAGECASPSPAECAEAVQLPASWAQLCRCLETELAVVDLDAGAVVHSGPLGPNWLDCSLLLHEVARRGRPEFIAEHGPLLLLAAPLAAGKGQNLVACGMFLHHPAPTAELRAAGERIGLAWRAVSTWAQAQPARSPDAVLAIAESLADRTESEEQVRKLRGDLEKVGSHLLSTYEEISLLHRLAQNLKLSSSDVELARMALDWLGEALPAESIILRLQPVDAAAGIPGAPNTVLLHHGEALLDEAQTEALLAELQPMTASGLAILNHAPDSRADWQFPDIHDVCCVPLTDGDHVFGYLAALNHCQDSEFGTVEASLLNSVAAILGIHRSNVELYREQAEFLASVVRAFTSAIDAKDPYTCGHSDRVARVAVRLAEELGCSPETLKTIYLSGLLHDIGKIGIDDNVLRKTGKLTPEEYEHIKLHPELGYKILKDLKQLDTVLPVVLHHHEAWDGSGYPHRLAGEEIPYLARIVAVADSFDAISSDRPYRKGMPPSKLEQIFREGAGQQWDANVIEAFFRVREDIQQIAYHDRENHAATDELATSEPVAG